MSFESEKRSHSGTEKSEPIPYQPNDRSAQHNVDATNSSPDLEEGGSNETAHEQHSDADAPLPPAREIVFILVICMAQFLSLAGLAQSIAPLNVIGR